MKQVLLTDNLPIYCLQKPEALVLDHHIQGYFHESIQLKDGDVVIDVGANIGVLGVRLLHKFPQSKVYAFEPIPMIYKVLEANAKRMGSDRFVALNMGLSTQAGALEFVFFPLAPALSTAHPEMWDDPSKFALAVKGVLKDLKTQFWWAKLIPLGISGLIARVLRWGATKMVCPLQTLSSVIHDKEIERIDLLKIDCEGAEWEVLQGIAAEDWPKIKQVVAEVHNDNNRLEQVKQLLTTHGLTSIHVEQEAGLHGTSLYNIFAHR